MGLRELVRRHMPNREQIQGNRRLAWLGPWLHQPKLWHWSRRGIALGVALGMFSGLLVPVAQIPLSVTAAVILRANVPAAVASTLITNPITFGPIYYGAYRIGAWVTGDAMPANAIGSAITRKINGESLWQRITALGKPLLVGLAITSTLMGLVTYGLITLVWRLRILSKRRNRRRS
ncbi:MAG: DUF2062 domain-containing protein [Glaciimonas sp.]|nr:DUF2062 domain-containing protein [Glaciimonas sp.]